MADSSLGQARVSLRRVDADTGAVGHDPLVSTRPAGVTRPRSRLFYLPSLFLWAAVAIRVVGDTSGLDAAAARLAVGLLLLYAALVLSEHAITRRFGGYPALYAAVQIGLLSTLTFLLPDLDYFAVLYVPLSAQAMLSFARPAAYRWIGAFTLAMAVGLLATQDWPTGLSLVFLYTGAYLFVASYAAVTQQAETAREQSQLLLADLTEANRRLEAAADQVEALAVIQERTRLARDLHDSVTQTLYGLTLSAEAAARQLAAGETSGAVAELRELRDTAQQALKEMRLLVFELRPPLLEQEGLAVALRERLQAVEDRVGLTTTLIVDGAERLSPAVEADLDRITQEALNNALKHAQARHVTVRLRQDERTVALEIADDGIGFDVDAVGTRGGLGLRGMAERAAQLGGRLAVESRPGGGTRIRVEVPR